MRFYLLFALFLIGCAGKPPNDPVCFRDSISSANCTFMVAGNDFSVNDAGKNYTLQGHNWTYDQLWQHSLWLPPETYGDIKQFFLNYCHQNKNVCKYADLNQRFTSFEQKMKSAMTRADQEYLEKILLEKEQELQKTWNEK